MKLSETVTTIDGWEIRHSLLLKGSFHIKSSTIDASVYTTKTLGGRTWTLRGKGSRKERDKIIAAVSLAFNIN